MGFFSKPPKVKPLANRQRAAKNIVFVSLVFRALGNEPTNKFMPARARLPVVCRTRPGQQQDSVNNSRRKGLGALFVFFHGLVGSFVALQQCPFVWIKFVFI